MPLRRGKDWNRMEKQGMVYLVGAGPGAWGLMTLRGMEVLQRCDAVVYDHLASEEFLSCLKEGCRRIYVGKQSGHHSMKQEEINEILLSLAREGLTVVRLKGGDPFVFGRGGEEALFLKDRGIPWELVPGVSSAIAVPELAGIPVTHRAVSRSFHVITGHKMKDSEKKILDMAPYARLEGTLVFLMGFGQLHAIVTGLMEAGKSGDTPAAVIENGTLSSQRVLRAPLRLLEEKASQAGFGTPAIIVVGEVASYDMLCHDKRPLTGICVGMVGTEHFQQRLRAALTREGAGAESLLTLEIISKEETPPMQRAYRSLKDYGWLVFTSANGVALFFCGLRKQGLDLRALGHLKFAVIGAGTKDKLEEMGFQADYMPEIYCAEELAKGLRKILTDRQENQPSCGNVMPRLLIPRSKDGSKSLTEIFKAAGIPFDDISLYELQSRGNMTEEKRENFPHYIVFASASGVRAFFDSGHPLLQSGWPEDTRALCIGKITARELENHGKKADLVAETYDVEGLIEALRKEAGGHEIDE